MLRNIAAGSLMLAGGFVLASLLYASGFELSWYCLWVISPYVVFFALHGLFRAPGSFANYAGCIVAVLMLVFTVAVYTDGLFIHPSSTSPLLFLFIPLYLLIGGPLAFGIVLGANRLVRRHRHAGT